MLKWERLLRTREKLQLQRRKIRRTINLTNSWMIRSTTCLKIPKIKKNRKIKTILNLSLQSHHWKLRSRKRKKRMRKTLRSRSRKRNPKRRPKLKKRPKLKRHIMMSSRKMKEQEFKVNSRNILRLVKKKFLKNQIHLKKHKLLKNKMVLRKKVRRFCIRLQVMLKLWSN